jgi:hypothetical protein
VTEPQPYEPPTGEAFDRDEIELTVPAGQWGWAHLQHPDPQIAQIHLLPTYDCGMHAFDGDCMCRPLETSPGFFAHNAFDGREQYEGVGGVGGRRKRH